jgi:hypothetical protein
VLLQLPIEGGVDVAGHGTDMLVAGADGTLVRIDGTTLQPEATLQVGAVVSAMTTSGDLLAVGAADGTLWIGNAMTGGFTAACDVGAPITSLHALDGTLFFGTQSGQVWRYDIGSGGIAFGFSVSNDAQAMASYAGTLLVGGTNETVERHDPATGALLETLRRDAPVRALATYDDPTEIELVQTTHSTSLPLGVNIDLALDAGPEHAGQFYLVLGSFQPVWQPGSELFVNGIGVPLVVDDYFMLTLSGAASGFLQNARGILPASGKATANFVLPPLPSTQSWLYAAHAAVTFDFGAGVVTASSTWRQFWAF